MIDTKPIKIISVTSFHNVFQRSQRPCLTFLQTNMKRNEANVRIFFVSHYLPYNNFLINMEKTETMGSEETQNLLSLIEETSWNANGVILRNVVMKEKTFRPLAEMLVTRGCSDKLSRDPLFGTFLSCFSLFPIFYALDLAMTVTPSKLFLSYVSFTPLMSLVSQFLKGIHFLSL